MSATILGISGSPVRNSNTDRAVQRVLEASGLESDFVKLSTCKLEPCRACLGCVKNNTCVVKDDGPALAEKFQAASAFVIGCYTPYSSLDARTKTFMERMYCLRHKSGLNRGKHGAAVITTACQPGVAELPPAAETAANQLAFWMMEEGMNNLGSVTVIGNVPCVRCGFGDSCELSGIKMLHGPDATVDSVGISTLEEEPDPMAAAAVLGQKLRQAVLG